MPQIKNLLTRTTGRGSAWQRTQQSLDQLAASVQQKLNQAPQRIPRAIYHARDPMLVSCSSWLSQGRWIELFVNPQDMRWQLPRRGTVVKTQGGAVRNTWRNRYRGTYYDEGTVGITFQSGNIMPSMGYDNSELRTADDVSVAILNPRVPPGLLNFYNFCELLDVPMLLGVGENRHILQHHSRVFPNLRLEGYFVEDSFTFSEVATDGNRLQWEATFQIYRATPPLNNANRLAESYQGFVASSALTEAYGVENMNRYLFAEGVSSLPGTFPAGNPRQGPTRAKQPTTLATSPKKLRDVFDSLSAAGELQGF